jgi:protein required for attachment to host cells
MVRKLLIRKAMRTQSGNYFKNKTHSNPVGRTWYVLANLSGAVIYEDFRDQKFKFIERMRNSRGRLTEGQMDSDRPGRGFSSAGSGTIRHGLDRTFHHHEQDAVRFARTIANHLTRKNKEEAFQSLVLVAEPHFLGLLRQALPEAIHGLIRHEVPREYLEGSDADLKRSIEAAIQK